MIGEWPVRSGNTTTNCLQRDLYFTFYFNDSATNKHHGDYEFDTVRNLFDAVGTR